MPRLRTLPSILRTLLLASVVCMTALPQASTLYADDGLKVTWKNGLKFTSEDKSINLTLGGRIHADYTFVSVDPELESTTEGNGFELRRARLFVKGTFHKKVEFKLQYDFAGGDPSAKDVFIGLKQDWGSAQFGHFKEPFNFEEMTSSNNLVFLERSLPSQTFSPSRNSGIRLVGDRGALSWGIGAFYEADDFALSGDEDNTNVTGRLVYRPLQSDDGRRLFHFGISASQKDRSDSIRFRSRPEAHDTGRTVSTGTFAADGANLYNFELVGISDAFWFAAEATQAEVDSLQNGDPSFSGYSLQAGYFLTKGDHRSYKNRDAVFGSVKPTSPYGKDGGKGAVEIAARYSTLDLNDGAIFGGEQDNYSLAVAWYLNSSARLMINWVHADVQDVGEADFFLARWQLTF